jgi:hypothetical protein
METYILLGHLETWRVDGMLACNALPDAPVLTEDPIGPLGRFARRVRRWRLSSESSRRPSQARAWPALACRDNRNEVLR